MSPPATENGRVAHPFLHGDAKPRLVGDQPRTLLYLKYVWKIGSRINYASVSACVHKTDPDHADALAGLKLEPDPGPALRSGSVRIQTQNQTRKKNTRQNIVPTSNF